MEKQVETIDIVDEMLLALTANIKYLEQEGGSQFTVRNGEFVTEVGGLYVYEFTLEFLQEIESDTEIEVRVKSRSANGKVIAVDGKKIQVQLETNLGPAVSEARVIISTSFLLQLLHDKIEKAKNGEVKLTELADKVFGLKEPRVDVDTEYTIPSLTLVRRDQPNEYQELAIRQALGSEVLFIWGPPGTGKTTTIAQIIEGYIGKGQSVLLLAHTNVATDGAFGDFVELQVNEESIDYKGGKFVRIGDIGEKSKLSRYEMVRLDVIEQKVGSAIRQEIDSLQNKISKIEKEVVVHQVILATFSRLDNVVAEVAKLAEQLRKVDAEIKQLKENQELNNQQLNGIEIEISSFQNKGPIGRFFTFERLEDIVARKVERLNLIQEIEQRISTSEKIFARGEERGQELLDERDSLEDKLEGKDRAVLQREYDSAQESIKPFVEQVTALTKELDVLRAKIISEAKVISTTLTKSYADKAVLAREYDCVIIDEASMAPLPAVWYACGLAKKSVVIVGDFYQLPPVVKHRVLKERKTNEEVAQEEDLIQKWLSRDIFAVVGIPEAIKSGVKPPVLQQLRVQYRMHPDIAEVINELVYSEGSDQFSLENGLNTLNRGEELLAQEPLANAHIGYYDTSEKHTYPTKTESGSYYNLYSAILCVELAMTALRSGYSTIGIVTPFRPQANLIHKILKDRNIDEEQIAVDTVHRFQGGQKQVIIFDLVTSQPTKLTDDNAEGGDDAKLINVAFSRAQEKCMVVGDIQTLLKKHSPSSLFRKYFNLCAERGHTSRNPEGIIEDFAASEETEKWLEKIYDADKLNHEVISSAVYDQSDFYKHFIKDLLEAEKEVIIDSPYITEQRMKTFYPIFHHLLQKGIKIFVLTRKSEEHDDQMKLFSENAIQKLDDMGVIVLPFKGLIHRKIAIIDRKLVWEGSLNILSQRESTEFMRRIQGEETGKQMMQFLRLEKNIGPLGQNHLVRCEICKAPGAWYWNGTGRFGAWTFCLIGVHKPGVQPKTEAEIKKKKKTLAKARKSKKQYTPDGSPICPDHDLPMVKKKGPWGEFWGCQKYPRCRITEKFKV